MAPLFNHALRPLSLFLFLLTCCLAGIVFPESVWVLRWLPLFALGWAAAWMRLKPNSWLNWLSVLISMASILHQFDKATLLLATMAFILVRFPLLKPVSILTWFGAISYSLYLVHVPIGGRVVNLGMRLNPDSLGRWGVALSAMAVSIFAAWIFHQFIEQPCQRWSRQLFTR
jgi:peptidoglycan/LPS O-acetylase OafA/YrhL